MRNAHRLEQFACAAGTLSQCSCTECDVHACTFHCCCLLLVAGLLLAQTQAPSETSRPAGSGLSFLASRWRASMQTGRYSRALCSGVFWGCCGLQAVVLQLFVACSCAGFGRHEQRQSHFRCCQAVRTQPFLPCPVLCPAAAGAAERLLLMRHATSPAAAAELAPGE